MRTKFSVLILLCFLSIAINAQEIVFPDLAGFKKETNYPVYIPANLWDFINGAADNYLTYGFIDLHVAEYKKGKDVIKVEIYRHKDHTMAFGIYSSERSPSFRFVNLGSQGYIVDGTVNFFKGNYYVKIRTYSKKAKTLQATETLAQKIAGVITGETEMPTMLAQFPTEGKKANEETFIQESVLGHSFLKGAFKALYQTGNDNFSVFVIKNDSVEVNKKTVSKYLETTGIGAVESGAGKYVLLDGYNGNIFLSWEDNTIVIISGLAKDQSGIAERYSSEILRKKN